MYLRRCHREKNGKRHAYWALVESYRTARGPRQRVVSYVGEMDGAGRLGVKEAAEGKQGGPRQGSLLGEVTKPEWVEVDVAKARVERSRDFGGPWLGLEMARSLKLQEFLEGVIAPGREEVPWPAMALVLALCRLCHPSSELHIAEHVYERSAMEDLLGVPGEKVNEDRLYRALDRLLPHKVDLEKHLKEQVGQLFGLDYDLLLYDVTSTYFEGAAEGNPQAQRGYSRDHRPDCKQVCIALVVTRAGMPLGYEVFAGNRSDVTTLKEVVETMEGRYGRAARIWVVDRGMVSEENIGFLKAGGRRYIVCTPKSMLKRFASELRSKEWDKVREGLEVKRCPAPDGQEVFLLCRSEDRRMKEQAMHERFEKRIEEGLEALAESCRRRPQDPIEMAKRVGKLLGKNSRAEGLFEVDIQTDATGAARLAWSKGGAWREWAALTEGCYVLRSNVTDWSPEDLWKTYIQLTEAEAAFRIHKSDLAIRPIWHQKEHRVQAHILVCFLAYVLWKTLARRCARGGLGTEPRKVLAELQAIKVVDVVLPTRKGPEIRKRCIVRPSAHQAILLDRLGLRLPDRLAATDL